MLSSHDTKNGVLFHDPSLRLLYRLPAELENIICIITLWKTLSSSSVPFYSKKEYACKSWSTHTTYKRQNYAVTIPLMANIWSIKSVSYYCDKSHSWWGMVRKRATSCHALSRQAKLASLHLHHICIPRTTIIIRKGVSPLFFSQHRHNINLWIFAWEIQNM